MPHADFSQELSTEWKRTWFSGGGFAIWVMNKRGRMFVGNHVSGEFHHSSFLSGADVMCGGEIQAIKGKIKLLSGKSGHYKPSIEHLIWALEVLKTCVDNFDQIKILVWKKIAYTSQGGLALEKGQPCLISPRTLMAKPILWNSWGDLTEEEKSWLKGVRETLGANPLWAKFPSQ
jgi:hypothetical protein